MNFGAAEAAQFGADNERGQINFAPENEQGNVPGGWQPQRYPSACRPCSRVTNSDFGFSDRSSRSRGRAALPDMETTHMGIDESGDAASQIRRHSTGNITAPSPPLYDDTGAHEDEDDDEADEMQTDGHRDDVEDDVMDEDDEEDDAASEHERIERSRSCAAVLQGNLGPHEPGPLLSFEPGLDRTNVPQTRLHSRFDTRSILCSSLILTHACNNPSDKMNMTTVEQG